MSVRVKKYFSASRDKAKTDSCSVNIFLYLTGYLMVFPLARGAKIRSTVELACLEEAYSHAAYRVSGNTYYRRRQGYI